MTSSILLPNSPAVGFDQPFEMLQACHERVNRSLALLQRLIEHIDSAGHDASSRSAAADVLRYFDIAAPLHHEDEEIHVFPLVANCNDEQISETVAQLKMDHVRVCELWAQLRQVLVTWREAAPAPAPTDYDRALVHEFTLCYAKHILLEETMVYPVTRALLDASALAEMGREMAARRRA